MTHREPRPRCSATSTSTTGGLTENPHYHIYRLATQQAATRSRLIYAGRITTRTGQPMINVSVRKWLPRVTNWVKKKKNVLAAALKLASISRCDTHLPMRRQTAESCRAGTSVSMNRHSQRVRGFKTHHWFQFPLVGSKQRLRNKDPT